MNRTIKFRAWLIKKKKWYDVDMTDSSNIGVLNVNFAPILCQYTGWAKDGVEIYEGDILRRDDGRVYEVVYKNDQARRGGRTFEQSYFCLDHPDGIVITPCINEFDIIGNIYENPNVLSQ